MTTVGEHIASISSNNDPLTRLSDLETAVRGLYGEGVPRSVITGNFTQPSVGSTVVVPVNSTSWMGVGLGIIITQKTSSGSNPIGGAYYVESIIDGINVVLRRQSDVLLPGTASATTIPAGSYVCGVVLPAPVADPSNVIVTPGSGQIVLEWLSDAYWTKVQLIVNGSPETVVVDLDIKPGTTTTTITGLSAASYDISLWHFFNGRFSSEVTVDNAGSGYTVT